MTEKEFYNLGKCDALAEIFMMLRINDMDYKKTFQELIDEYEKIDPENPHFQWLKAQLKKEG